MKIIPAQIADFDSVRRITQETIRTVYPRYYPQGAVDYFLAHHSDAAIERDINENRVYLCISDADEVTGTVTVSGSEIGRLFVLPQFQGKGYGGKLLSFAELEIARNYEFAVLDVSFPAKAIYLKRGYQAVGWHAVETECGDYLCFDEMKKQLKPEHIAVRIYQLVRMKNNRYESDGIYTGDIGTVLEVYDDIACEVEFSRPNGKTYALQAIRIEDLEIISK